MKKESQLTQSQRALSDFAHHGRNRIGSNWLINHTPQPPEVKG